MLHLILFFQSGFLKLLWCSYGSNMINIHDMKQNRVLDPIRGARLDFEGTVRKLANFLLYYLKGHRRSSWEGDTMLEPLPDSGCIISSVSLLVPKLQQERTNFTVFGMLNRPKEVFNFGTIKGCKYRLANVFRSLHS